MFTIVLEIKENCTKWIVSSALVLPKILRPTNIQAAESAEIAEDIAKNISKGIELMCNCTLPSDYIAERKLSCQNQKLVFMGRIISTAERDSTDLLADFELWITTQATITSKGKEFTVTEYKNISTATAPESAPVAIIGASVGAAVAALLVIVTVSIAAAVLVWHKQRQVSQMPQWQIKYLKLANDIFDVYLLQEQDICEMLDGQNVR